jgi:hypothetical protein
MFVDVGQGFASLHALIVVILYSEGVRYVYRTCGVI